MFSKFISRMELAILILLNCCIFSGSSLVINNHTDQVREFTRPVEFDYFDWTIRSIGGKLLQTTIDTPFYFEITDQHELVVNYLKITDQIINKESQLNIIFIDPGIKDPTANSKLLRQELSSLYQAQEQIAPFAESILEQQVSRVIVDEGLSFEGQPIPPVLFHISPLPYNLIISPRNKIQQQDSISLISDLPGDKQVSMEEQVQKKLNVSALVVPVGGIGSFPTMVEQSTSLDWLSKTIAHEWIHNWLSFRPLGQHYDFTNELRTMNETTASIAGDEIGKLVIKRYYPELTYLIPTQQLVNYSFSHPDPNDLPVVQFDFRVEMHKTRVEVDGLLAEGKIDEAEKFMEYRRKIFWDNGYAIRKLNQAYFAFYGAYADVPGGAAGEDPVGPAVRALRSESPSLSIFLHKISQMTSFDELIAATSH